MTNFKHLAEQHIIEHESRLKHFDELLDRAGKRSDKLTKQPEIETELENLRKERDRLASRVDELKLRSLEDWKKEEIEKAGPMGIWDAVAQQLEKLVERIER